MLKIEVKSLKKLNKQLDKIIEKIPNSIESAVMQVMKQTADLIIYQAPVNTGNLKSSIKYELLDVQKGEITGRIYSDINIAPYALWVNYGTGIYAEGEGGSRAKRIPWFVHESMANLSQYGYPMWEAPSGDKFYIVEGMRATHFFDSAEFIMRPDNVNAVTNSIKDMLKEVT